MKNAASRLRQNSSCSVRSSCRKSRPPRSAAAACGARLRPRDLHADLAYVSLWRGGRQPGARPRSALFGVSSR